MISPCLVPDCAAPAVSYGVCIDHRRIEQRIDSMPSADELVVAVKTARDEQKKIDEERRRQFSAELRVNDDDWDGHTTRYGRAALQGMVDEVAKCVAPGRNNTLFKNAARLGGLIGSGHVMESVAVQLITNAGLACGLDQHEVTITVRGAIAKGKQKPWGPTK